MNVIYIMTYNIQDNRKRNLTSRVRRLRMKYHKIKILIISCLFFSIFYFQAIYAQENIAQEAYAIFEQSCLGCHGESGAYKDSLLIDRTELIDTKVVIPEDPENSEFYRRLLGPTENGPQMPLNLPPLSQDAIDTIARWITAGAPDWDVQLDINFITTDTILDTIQTHLLSLDPFDRPSARYFTMTHLHNAGENPQTLNDYQIALSKLINSLSWKFEITNPTPIDTTKTIFYIDLRHYEWNTRNDVWTLVEQVYPYNIDFDPITQADLLVKLIQLQAETGSTIPYVHVDWFLATASLPPLYHDILDLPLMDRLLEAQLEVDVASNIRNAPGINVWRAGFNDSGVSSNNRVVERHTSRYGAYWKSYDFAGSTGSQNIFTHPLDFTHDGGEIIFNLPNGLQAYFLADAEGNRLDEAPIDIVSNPAASDPTVRNGLSCIGCHDQGMKTFTDSVRAAIEQDENPPYNRELALRLYPEQSTLNELLQKDTQRFQQALETIGGPFEDEETRQRFFKRHENEPIQRFHEVFQGPLDASQAAAAVGLETTDFLTQISEKQSLKNLGLQTLIDVSGTVKRDAWTSNFHDIIFALNTPDSDLPPVEQRPEFIPGETVDIPDPNLRAVIEMELGKASGDTITALDMSTLERLDANDKDISDLTGLEFATNLSWLAFKNNTVSDLSPLAGLTNLTFLWFEGTRQVSDLSPLTGLINLEKLHFSSNSVSDLSPLRSLVNLTSFEANWTQITDISLLAEFVNLEWFRMWGSPVSDLSPLAGLTKLRFIEICGAQIADLTPLTGLTNLTELNIAQDEVLSDISPLAVLTGLERLSLRDNSLSDLTPLVELTGLQRLKLDSTGISDISFLEGLTELTHLSLHQNMIWDISPLANLTKLRGLSIQQNMISDISPLAMLIHLEELDLRDNPISDYSPLDEFFKNPNAKFSHTEVNFPDQSLRAAIEVELNKPSGDAITAVEMSTIERLNLNDKDITDLTGLEFARNLNWLAINDNNISDFSPIGGLTRLTELRFHRNPVADLSPLMELTNLTGMWFDNTQVADLSPLAGLIKLKTVIFASPNISDLSPLSSLKNLTVLWPRGHRISDLSPVAELISLEDFLMWGSPVSDLSPFAGLTKMRSIDICGAKITDITPMAGLTGLKTLRFAANKISDVSPIAGLTELTNIELRDNNISDISSLAGLTELTHLGIHNNNITDFSPLDGIRDNLTHFIWHGNPGFPEGGPKIEGPWLWVNNPDPYIGVGVPAKDLLSEVSGGEITEEDIATHGAIEGNSVGNSVWTSHKLLPTGRIADQENLGDVLNVNLPPEDYGVLYGFVSIYSPQEQETTMYVGAQGGIKTWLNGTVVFAGGDYGGKIDSYTNLVPVTLKQGKNIVLIRIRLVGSAFVGFEPGTEYTVGISSVEYVLSDTLIRESDTFTLHINAKDVYDMAGWQFDIEYDSAILEAVDVSEGDFLKVDGAMTYFSQGTIDNTTGKITGYNATQISADGVTGTGTLLSITFLAKAVGETKLFLNNFQFGSITGEEIPAGPREFAINVGEKFDDRDVNRDGVISVLDMILVSINFGEDATEIPEADVNNDGKINIQDLILVSQNLGNVDSSAAPAGVVSIDGYDLNPATIQTWIQQAQAADDGSLAFRQGIENLQKLLASLVPEKTVLLANYPNPFNPETWIPYQLANPAEVTLTIYAANGVVVRTLALGYQVAGMYQSRSRAAYWDGKNEVGESVANGIYFYTLSAGDFTATRKMLIVK